MQLHTSVGQTCDLHMCHVPTGVRARCAPTTVDERLQQLLLGQALVHFHPHYVTAEPLRLLLRLGERENRQRHDE